MKISSGPGSLETDAPALLRESSAKPSLREVAYRQLSDLLASGALGPGDKISLRAAAEAFGVSVMPVREAVSRLVADSALEVTPNRAVRVPVMTRQQFSDLTRVRM